MGFKSPSRPQVVFNEYGLLQGGQGGQAYLPLCSGVLHACALERESLRDAYDFRPYLFHRDRPERILAQYENPAVAAFSAYMWNLNLSLTVAREVKARHPECLVVFGGASVPHRAETFMNEHAFVDVCARGEGEDAFVDVLERNLESRCFDGIAGITWRRPDGTLVTNAGERSWIKDLDVYASPYRAGLYEELIERHTGFEFQAIVESNRGCPFRCTFCYWGKGGLNRKFKFHSPERIAAEIDWCGRHRIRYVLSADSNFGMHEQDRATARALIASRERYGYPERFRATYGKNTDDRIFDIASSLHRAGLDKGVSLARQSTDRSTLINIKRANIKMSTYRSLQQRFNEAGIPTHTDLIIGLPGENLNTLAEGIDELLESGCVHLNIYFLEVYPNTEMADPAYQRQFGIRAVRTELRENHCDVRDPEQTPEYVDVVVETSAMTVAEWKRMWRLAFITMLFHSLKAGFYLMHYLRDRLSVPFVQFLRFVSQAEMRPETGAIVRGELARFDRGLDGILAGWGHNVVEPDFGNVYWRIEETSLLHLSERWDAYYAEMETIIQELLDSRGLSYDVDELCDVIRYQRVRMPSTRPLADTEVTFSFNVPDYFNGLLDGRPRQLLRRPQTVHVESVDYAGDRERFARERVLYARKNESTVNALHSPATSEIAGSEAR